MVNSSRPSRATINRSKFLPNGRENFFHLWESEPALLGHNFIIHPHRKLASVAFLQLRFNSEFALDHVRHTGGSRTVRSSNFAMPYTDTIHMAKLLIKHRGKSEVRIRFLFLPFTF